MLNKLIDRFQAKFPPNRVVALALALLTAPLTVASGYVATWVPAHFPGLPTFTPVQLLAFGLAGAGAVLLPAVVAGYKWLDGWQKHEHWLNYSSEPLSNDMAEAAHIEARSRERAAAIEAGNQLDFVDDVLPSLHPPLADPVQPKAADPVPGVGGTTVDPPDHGGVAPTLRTPPPAS